MLKSFWLSTPYNILPEAIAVALKDLLRVVKQVRIKFFLKDTAMRSKSFKASHIVACTQLAEGIAILLILLIIPNKTELVATPFKCLLCLGCSILLRLAWQSAIIIHGWGHTVAIALTDKDLSVLNLTNILEHQPIDRILKSLLLFHPSILKSLSPSYLPLLPIFQQGIPNT